jgi:hypothetical protein
MAGCDAAGWRITLKLWGRARGAVASFQVRRVGTGRLTAYPGAVVGAAVGGCRDSGAWRLTWKFLPRPFLVLDCHYFMEG